MNAERIHEFLNGYKMLEDLLEDRYADRPRRYSSVMMEFIHSPEGDGWREKADLCREIRNLMTHTADIAGESVVTPAQGVVDALNEILEYVRRPPLALDYATAREDILRVSGGDLVLPVMRAMHKRGFSHVPVMRGDVMTGVFSVSTIFSSIILRDEPVNEQTRVRDFDELLPIDRHMAEQFVFLGRDATLNEARLAFDRTDRKRTAAVFITEDGTPSGRLLGMITPWDVLRKK